MELLTRVSVTTKYEISGDLKKTLVCLMDPIFIILFQKSYKNKLQSYPYQNQMADSIPKDLRGLRACLSCSLIKTMEQFESDGCDNCDSFLHMRDNKDNV